MEDPIIRNALPFNAQKMHTVMSGLVVRWTLSTIGGWEDAPEINASRNGVSFGGAWPILDGEALESVLKVIADAKAMVLRIRAGDELAEVPRKEFP